MFDFLKIFFTKLFSLKIIDDHYQLYFFHVKINFKSRKKICFKSCVEYGLTLEKRCPKIILSLTTFPSRIETVHITISSLLSQSLKPDKIILWLAREQFPKFEADLPQDLVKLTDYGLEIKWCEDLRSYKKLIPTLKEYPEDIIITFDDDYYYSPKIVESLYHAYKNEPQSIHARHAFRIKKDKNNFILTPFPTIPDKTYEPSFLNEFIGCGAVLYPPKCLHQDVLCKEVFMKKFPTHDDIWFWSQAVRNGTKISIIRNNYKLKNHIIENTQEDALWKTNKETTTTTISGSDCLNAVCREYPEIPKKLLN